MCQIFGPVNGSPIAIKFKVVLLVVVVVVVLVVSTKAFSLQNRSSSNFACTTYW